MIALLNPRFLIGLALVAILSFTHFTAYRKGAANVRSQWAVSVAQANAEARSLEQARQRRADEAGRLAAARETRLRVDASRASDAVRGLRDDLSAVRLHSEKSRAAADQAVVALSDVFEQCSRRYSEVAEQADRATSEAVELREAWPK